MANTIAAIDLASVHKITSGQVVVDLQTAVKELVENSLDSGATNIEVRFKEYGVKSLEVIDNGSGIAPDDYESIGLKHYTSKLSKFSDVATVQTFGFRGEALSSLCALSDGVVVITARIEESPVGTMLELQQNGQVGKQSKVAQKRGTTVAVTNLFKPLPVRRKEFERNAKREFGKALNLLNAYALGPCARENKGVRLTVSNQADNGRKTIQLRTDGSPSIRSSVTSLWGPKALEHIVALDLSLAIDRDKTAVKRIGGDFQGKLSIKVQGLISKFSPGCGRTGTDRQFFFVNGRPCNLAKIQKAFNEVYRSFNTSQSPFIVADFVIPPTACDINVSPDKRTVLLHSETNLIAGLKVALEETFQNARSTYAVGGSQAKVSAPAATPNSRFASASSLKKLQPEAEDEDEEINEPSVPSKSLPAPVISSSDSAAIQVRASTSTIKEASMLAKRALSVASTSKARIPSSPARKKSTANEATVPPKRALSVASISKARIASPPASIQATADSDSDELEFPSSPEPEPEPPRNKSPVILSSKLEGRKVSLSTSSATNKTATTTVVGVTRNIINALKPTAKSPTLIPINDIDVEMADEEDDTNQMQFTRRVAANKSAKVSIFDSWKVTPIENTNTKMKPVVLDTSKASWNAAVVTNPTTVPEEDSDQLELEKGPPRKKRRESQLDYVEELDDSSGWVVRTSTSKTSNTSMNVDEPADIQQSMVIDVDSESEIKHETIDLTERSNIDDGVDELLSSSSHSLPEVIRTAMGDVSIRFDLNRVTDAWKQLRQSSTSSPPDVESLVPVAASISNADDDNQAVDALSRVIVKSDFSAMKVVGQFNLGFIIARLRKPSADGELMDDLYIVDQHAADEKYNFETLQATTVIQSQKLIIPQPLELTAADELLALENVDVLRQNGFIVSVDNTDLPMGQGQRLKLVAQPVSKNTVFDMKDLEEIIHLLEDQPTGHMVRCSKARSMFAMRACRKSVMIGKALNKGQMKQVVHHMGTMDSPWCCPHGRPTMRHLSDISRSQRTQRSVDWAVYN